MNKEMIKGVISILAVILFFVLASYFIQKNIGFIQDNLDFGIYGMIVFIIVLILSIVAAPVSVIPMIPLASGLWGWIITGFLCIIGWTIGAAVAFWLARKYGVGLVDKIISIDKIYKYQDFFPEKHLFFTVLFLRMVMPVDGLSYFMGLFTKMKFYPYLSATIIGITPFSFVFAYAGTLNIWWQIFFLGLAGIIFCFGIIVSYYSRRLNKKAKHKNKRK